MRQVVEVLYLDNSPYGCFKAEYPSSEHILQLSRQSSNCMDTAFIAGKNGRVDQLQDRTQKKPLPGVYTREEWYPIDRVWTGGFKYREGGNPIKGSFEPFIGMVLQLALLDHEGKRAEMSELIYVDQGQLKEFFHEIQRGYLQYEVIIQKKSFRHLVSSGVVRDGPSIPVPDLLQRYSF